MQGVICRLREHPEWAEPAAQWFADRWGVPKAAYQESIQACLDQGEGVPQWYVVLAGDAVVAGAGVIAHDFHDRNDLTPNLCALFVQEEFRGQGIARALLQLARRDAAAVGIPRLYLVTDHTAFYERCGWTYLTMAREEDGSPIRVYTAPTAEVEMP